MMTTYQDRFIALSQFLKSYSDLHALEFLKKYPKEYPSYMASWLKELGSWNFAQIAELESFPHETLVQDKDFKIFLKTIRELTDVEVETTAETPLNPGLLRKLNPKKKHEIQTLKTIVDGLKETSTIIDIGGGVGHLSCALISQSDKRSLCVDINKELQTLGAKKINNWLAEEANQIHFITENFGHESDLRFDFDAAQSTILGLHSCGSLSTSLIKYSIKNKIKNIINFSCCYHKLTNQYNISMLSKAHGLLLTNNALHLAGRSSAVVDEGIIKSRYQFKRFRYSLHYFLHDRFQTPFAPLGNARKSDYTGRFCDYAKKFYLGDELNFINDDELMDFYESPRTKFKVHQNYLADTIRLFLGRAIELYIILDRAIFLQENGYQVQVVQAFRRDLSPRNIMIKACLGPQLL